MVSSVDKDRINQQLTPTDRQLLARETVRIVHGDCIKVMSELSAESVDLVVTDPPYGIQYKSNAQGVDRKHRNATNETRVIRESFFDEVCGDTELPVRWISGALRVLKDSGAMYVFCHWTKWAELHAAVSPLFTIKNMIVLNKSNHGMGDLNGQYAPKHELLMYATKGRHLLNRESGRGKDVWDVPVRFSGARRYHPNEKPLAWLSPCIANSSKPGDIILDPFAGSGSTGLAAIEMSRRCILVDIDESYCSVMRERLHGQS